MRVNEPIEIALNGERLFFQPEILEKYNQPGPRYTSYPTAPEWSDSFDAEDWLTAINETGGNQAPLSLYVHLPFCQPLCLFCGCNVVISKKHEEISDPYLNRLKKEIDWLGARVGPERRVAQLHWGGGTPTYLSAEQIEELF